mmetsp:Transcript_5656/g.11535  ORF Transcript_5656/g.11535 Transcript_5656/m.11535 type:complete len:287 (+) Transcript_5656:289-1149(+)
MQRVGQQAKDEADVHTLLALWEASTSRPGTSLSQGVALRRGMEEGEREQKAREIARRFEHYSEMLRCDITNEMALEGLVHMHEMKRECVCTFDELFQPQGSGCTCGRGTPCTSSFLAKALAEHLDACPWNRNAWSVLSHLLPAMPKAEVTEVAKDRQWWVRSHFCLDSGSPIQSLAAQLEHAARATTSSGTQALSQAAQERHQKGKRPAEGSSERKLLQVTSHGEEDEEEIAEMRREWNETRLHLQHRWTCAAHIIQDTHIREQVLSGITNLLETRSSRGEAIQQA